MTTAPSGAGEYVFPTRFNPHSPMHQQTANQALVDMGFKGELVSHGLRSIASTILNAEGFAPDVIEAALAHVDMNTIRRVYNRNDYLEQRRKLMDWCRYRCKTGPPADVNLTHPG